MTNEIKETLDLFYNEYPREEKRIENYITNLQEENERLKDYLKIMEKGKDNNLHRFLDYKQRIDKAINYILENICCDTRVYTKNENVYKVIDILRGDK